MATNQPVQTVIVDRPGATPSGDVVLVKMQPVVSILVRTARTYVQSLIGFLAVLMVTDTLPAADFGHVLLTAASWAVAPAAISFLHNLAELLARLDETAAAIRA